MYLNDTDRNWRSFTISEISERFKIDVIAQGLMYSCYHLKEKMQKDKRVKNQLDKIN